MAADLGPAWIGLIGVLVGSVISTGANLGLAWRKETVDARTAAADRAAQLRKSARLVDAELAVTEPILNFYMTEGHKLGPEPSVEMWESEKGVLAGSLTEQEWGAVRKGMLSTLAFRFPLNAETREETLRTLLKSVKDARQETAVNYMLCAERRPASP